MKENNKYEIAEQKEREALNQIAPRIGCTVIYTTPIGSKKSYDGALQCAKHIWKIEIKLRDRMTTDFPDCIFERYKFDELTNLTYGDQNEYKADKSMFVVQYNDYVHFWEISSQNEYNWLSHQLQHTSTNSTGEKVWKDVTYLPFSSTTYQLPTKK